MSLGCFHDDIRTRPETWAVVGCIPVFNHKEAKAAGRPGDGPDGCPRRAKELLHQAYAKVFEDWNEKTRTVKYLKFADGIFRRCKMIVVGLIGDQPETDDLCCDGSQSCKCCKCPKDKLHEVGHRYQAKSAAEVKKAVRDAYAGKWPGWENAPEQCCSKLRVPGPKVPIQLFELKEGKWCATAACTQAVYSRVRTALRGVHLMENAFWEVYGLDIQLQVYLFTSSSCNMHVITTCIHMHAYICIPNYIHRITYTCISM